MVDLTRHKTLNETAPEGRNWCVLYGQRVPSEEVEALWHVVPTWYTAYIEKSRGGISVAHQYSDSMLNDYLLIQYEDIHDLRTWQWTLAELERLYGR